MTTTTPRTCEQCGAAAPDDARTEWRYCSDRCRQAAYRARKYAAAHKGRKPPATPLPKSFGAAVYRLGGNVTTLKALTADGRFSRNREALQRNYWDLVRARDALDEIAKRIGPPPPLEWPTWDGTDRPSKPPAHP